MDGHCQDSLCVLEMFPNKVMGLGDSYRLTCPKESNSIALVHGAFFREVFLTNQTPAACGPGPLSL